MLFLQHRDEYPLWVAGNLHPALGRLHEDYPRRREACHVVRYPPKEFSEETLPVGRHHDCLGVVGVGRVHDGSRDLLHARWFGLRLNVRVFVSDGEFLRQGFDLPSQLFGEGVFLLFPLEHVGHDDLRARVFGEVEGDVDCIPLTRLESDGEDDGGVAPGPFYALPPFSHPWSLLGTSDR